ncbi:hypothetical protein GCM10009557_34150 [Virgisporangium ochraceum]|uniref:Uncharacterized protein n=1 Tax=Virgisporangium ochraceum TaxID=65505 RepID=A0A8J4A3Z8_9ACTN|nr:hypothetical protein [Virgisporangium ochraceum]GIJ75449.1 hypothetical protein Voc01_103660 [Virgisporangium ochraceum]
MPTAPNPPEPDPAQFDRIVSQLRSRSSQSTGSTRTPTSGPTLGDFGFVISCLAVIVPMSMVVGGWVGLTLLFVSVFVAARLIAGPNRRQRR